jgi:hypothetical protein
VHGESEVGGSADLAVEEQAIQGLATASSESAPEEESETAALAEGRTEPPAGHHG